MPVWWPARPTLAPRIRFLFIGPRLCLYPAFKPHLAMTPLGSAILHLHQVGPGTCTRSRRTCAAYKKGRRRSIAQWGHYIFDRNVYATSSSTAAFTLAGAAAYFSGSITELARPWLIDRSSVV